MPSFITLLTDVPFRNDYKSPIYFHSISERSQYFAYDFELTVAYDYGYDDYRGTGENTLWTEFNFPKGTFLRTGIEVGIPSGVSKKYGVAQGELSSVNYLILAKDCAEYTTTEFLFYFVTDIKETTRGTMFLSLELDVITTYSPFMSFSGDVFTERKHCNRFTKTNEYGSYQYFMRNDTGVMMPDELDAVMINKATKYNKRYDVLIPYSSGYSNDTEVNELLNETVWGILWFSEANLSSGNTIKVPSATASQYKYRASSTPTGNEYDTGLYAIVAPLTRSWIKDDNGNFYEWSLAKALEQFGESPNLVSVQLTPLCPLYSGIFDGDTFYKRPVFNELTIYFEGLTAYTDYGNGLVCSNPNYLKQVFYTVPDNATNMTNSFVGIIFHGRESVYDIVLPSALSGEAGTPIYNTSTNFSNNVKRDYRLEPKLYIPPYRELILRTHYNEGKIFNMVDLWGSYTTTPPKLRINHQFEPSQDKYFATLEANASSSSMYYKNTYARNLGLIFSQFYTLPTGTDPFKEYVANKRNYMLSGLASIAQAGVGGYMVGGAVGAGISAGFAGLNFVLDVNNMKNAPDTVALMANDVLHDVSSGNYLGFFLIENTLNDDLMAQAFDYYFRYGYKVNKFCPFTKASSTYKDGVFNRTRFNYIKLNDEQLYGKLRLNASSGVSAPKLPHECKVKICDILNTGATFWAYNAGNRFSMDYENMEIYNY